MYLSSYLVHLSLYRGYLLAGYLILTTNQFMTLVFITNFYCFYNYQLIYLECLFILLQIDFINLTIIYMKTVCT